MCLAWLVSNVLLESSELVGGFVSIGCGGGVVWLGGVCQWCGGCVSVGGGRVGGACVRACVTWQFVCGRGTGGRGLDLVVGAVLVLLDHRRLPLQHDAAAVPPIL